MTPSRLQELKKLCSEATPGPWESNTDFFENKNGADTMCGTGPIHNVVIYDYDCGGRPVCEQAEKDADLISAARTALPELIESYEKLYKEMKWIAGINQDSILEAPEVWGVVLETARRALGDQND